MPAISYTSIHFDAPDAIIADLAANGAEDISENALGMLYCDSQVDCRAVLEGLEARLRFPVVGGSAMAFPYAGPDGGQLSAALLVMQNDALRFSVSVSETLRPEACREQMRDTYERGLAALGGPPKMVMPLFPLWPGLPTNVFIDEIFSLAGGLPVFGGVTTNDLINTEAAVFADGEVLTDRMALVMLGGDIHPVFATSNQISPMVEYAPVVTLSEGSEVLRVEEQSFCDYMRSIGIKPEQRVNGVDALMQYGPTPAIVMPPEHVETDAPQVRCISYTNLQRGSAVFSGRIPEGSRLRMGLLRKSDVTESTTACLDKLQARMAPAQERGYEYSALFCLSCVARYFALVGGPNFEHEILTNHPLSTHAAIGAYVFCEVSPVYGGGGNALQNGMHSASIIMCAI